MLRVVEQAPCIRVGRDEARSIETAISCYRLGRFDESDTPEGKHDFRGIRILRKLVHGEEATYDELRIAAQALERIARACDEQTRKEWWQENASAAWESPDGLFRPGTIDHYINVRRTQLSWVVSAAHILYDAMELLNPMVIGISDTAE